ncbi:MAG: cysteine--tRNA ligase [Vicinamibacteria bacterium]|nr:cysteine--tRNA ligase [Vicinamibacteria bacterium]
MTRLKLYNTLSGRIEEIVPSDGQPIKMYVCGPTVYSRAHIGNFRTFMATDMLRRTLKFLGMEVLEVMNITDVDDRIIQLASAKDTNIEAFTEEPTRAYLEDLATLRMEIPEVMPKATEHVGEMIALIEQLMARGHTYTVDGSVYFRIASFPSYGGLSRLDVSGIKTGARVDTDKYEKEDARDFVLWKLKGDEPPWAQWDASFGRGRPGWHIECSAMSMKYLGETFDIHCGGVDLIFPHHENEIAQSECGTGKLFAKHWMHVDHLLVENETMSKSKGNVYNIPDLLARGFRSDQIRYMLAQSHYRKAFNFTWDGLAQVETALARIHTFWNRLLEETSTPAGPAHDDVVQAATSALAAFEAALANDLNAPEALAAVHGLVSEGNSVADRGTVNGAGARVLLDALKKMDQVFACFEPPTGDLLSGDEQALFDARQDARKRRDFSAADVARKALQERGVILEDTAKGTRWKRVRA